MSTTTVFARASMRQRLEPVARVLMQAWYLKTMASRMEAITPRDLPQYRWHGAAHRVLLIGNGPTHGWGVLTHGFSLTGQLGVELHQASSQPVNVDYVGDELMNVQTAKDWIADVDIAAYDAVIVLLGWNDAVRLTPESIWEEHIAALFDELRTRKRPEAGIVAVGIESISPATGYAGLVGRLGQQHAHKLNDVLERQLVGQREAFLHLGERVVEHERPHGSPATYRPWAAQIAQVVAPLLPKQAPVQQLERDTQPFGWAGAARALNRDGRGANRRFVELEEEAKAAFGMQVAQVTIIDGDRQWFPNHSGPAPTSAPRHLTYCNVTAQHPGMLIIPNAAKDGRFKGNAYLEQMHMPFYAGVALHSRAGDVIGSFCVLDAVPRPRWWTVNKRKFTRMAHRAQEELWRIEDEVRAEGGFGASVSHMLTGSGA